MTSFVNVCDVKSAEKHYVCLKIVNEYDMRSYYRSLGSFVVRKKEFWLKGFISLDEINLSRQKQNYQFNCLINHGIFPPNM